MMDVNRAWRVFRSLALVVLFVTVCGLPAAADYDAGKRAWDAGKPAEALAQWRKAAAAGDRRSMLALGRLYLQGLGAPQDYVLAHMWFNLAASRGEKEALKERDSLVAKMTPAERAEAQKRAREWRPKRRKADTGTGSGESGAPRVKTPSSGAAQRAASEQKGEKRKQLDRTLVAGKEFRDCEACPLMVVVPAGSFIMGSSAREKGRYDNEGSRHDVQITRRFAAGRYEVTRDEYGMFVQETGHHTPGGCRTGDGKKLRKDRRRSWQDPGYDQTGRDPVVCVAWHDAKAYVEWLSGKTGQEYRLLSESEWEYAARAGTGRRRFWGEDSRERGLCRRANGAGSESSFEWRNKACRDGYKRTSPVGSFGSNDWGLDDMIGNVWEWVEDCWHEDYSGAPTDGSAWTSGGGCSKRVLRGGAWNSFPRNLRSAVRHGGTADVTNYYIGFRIARTLIP